MGLSEFVVSIFVCSFFGFYQGLVKEVGLLVKGRLGDFFDFFVHEMYFREWKISSLSDGLVGSGSEDDG